MKSSCMLCGRYFKIVTVWEADYRTIVQTIIDLYALIEAKQRAFKRSFQLRVGEACEPLRTNANGVCWTRLSTFGGVCSGRSRSTSRGESHRERNAIEKHRRRHACDRVVEKSDAATRSIR